MLFNYIMLALCVSIDSLGTGITYGLKDTRISFLGKVVLFIYSFFITSFCLFIGNIISNLLSEFLCNLVGFLILLCMGIWIILQALKEDKEDKKVVNSPNVTKNFYSFFIKSLGITIQIIRDPNYSDMDNSKNIDWKESLFLALALSLDSIGVSIGGSIIGVDSFLFPILVAFFQLIFLLTGSFLGNKIKHVSKIPNNIWNVVAGILLIILGLCKFFF